MRTGIATLSVRGRLLDKLPAIAAAGFDGVEVFDNDLVACRASPREVAARCADLGLSVDLFQPVRDAAGVVAEEFGATLRRVRAKLAVAAELGAPVVLVCSHVGDAADDDPGLLAAQLHAVGDAAADHGLTIAFEALAWGRHVNRVGQAWDAVRRADHPAVTLAVDTFHMLARGDDGGALAGVPGDRIGFVQVADGPLLDMGVLEWSRHFRCFPGQGALDVAGVVAAALQAGYRGPVSLEVFSDLVREADPAVIARDGFRSLVFLEGELADRLTGAAAATVNAPPPAPERTDLVFVELANPEHSAAPEALLTALGFAREGDHRSKPVSMWRNGGAHVVLNDGPDEPGAHALGLATPDVAAVAARATALRWPPLESRRGAGEARLPGITSPSGVHLFLSATLGEPDDWRGDFEPTSTVGAGTEGWTGLDHVGIAVPSDRLDEEVGFLRTVFGLEPAPVQEFWEPQGRLLSRALRPAVGLTRLVLNVEDVSARAPRAGITQVAFGCTDLLAEVPRLRQRGVPLMAVPDNYYVDLAARFDLPESRVAELRELGVLYDRAGDGELLQVFTDVLATGFYVELLERRGGYDGYGTPNTHVRLASQLP